MSVHHHSKELAEALKNKSQDGALSCAAAFTISGELTADPEDIGKLLDLEEINIIKCQLGLFGYSPDKKIIRPAQTVSPELRDVITARLENGRLPCAVAWAIAEELDFSKLDVSTACESLGIKISECQLGAF